MLVTLVFLALFACMAVAIASQASMNMTLTRNRANAQQAGALAEAGLRLAQSSLGGLSVPSTSEAIDLNQAIADHLREAWNASAMTNADSIAYYSNHHPQHRQFRPGGADGQLHHRRKARPQRALRPRPRQQGQDRDGRERTPPRRQQRWGRKPPCRHQQHQRGVINPNGTITKGPNVEVGGDEIIGVHEPEWPEPDVSIFRPYATNVQSGGTSGNTLLTNILIPPNTNPTFDGNTFIYGVVYVQSPNTVTFAGNTTLVGCVVCEPPAIENLDQNKLEFTGNLSSSGVENLPPGAQFDGLRELTGASILAQGYAVEFGGNFNTISGAMIAAGFEFTGNASGQIRGGVVALSDAAITLGGNANLTIDRENASDEVAGVTSGLELVCVSGSYSE
ncbi:MAG: hypothetical protein AMS14_11995 [Planctomycetes bacterium DG_20]|nr:MAG: hypothetical protein AMS14_11995 [Planctomycetes bacterium DG_20]